MVQIALFLICCPIILTVLLYRRPLSYRQRSNGSWIAEERKVFGGTLTTWREVRGGRY